MNESNAKKADVIAPAKSIVLRRLVKHASERKQASEQRVKLAQQVLRLRELQKQLATFYPEGFRKVAEDSPARQRQLKYAALKLQYETEKRAIVGRMAAFGLENMAKLLNLGAKFSRGTEKLVGKGLTHGLSGTRRLMRAGWQTGVATAPHVRKALSSAARETVGAIRDNPVASTLGAGAIGTGVGVWGPSAYESAHKNIIAPAAETGADVYNVGGRAYDWTRDKWNAITGNAPSYTQQQPTIHRWNSTPYNPERRHNLTSPVRDVEQWWQ